MSTFSGKILLATDGSEDAALAARAAIDISRGTGSELHLVHVLEPIARYGYTGVTSEIYSYVLDQEQREVQKLFDRETKRVQTEGGSVTEVHSRRGPVADEILNLAGELEASLIVVGSRGLGPVKRLVLGSVSEGLVHGASCPVLVLRGGPEAWPPERIVVGDDGSEAAKEAGEQAARIAKMLEAKVLLMGVYPRLPEIDVEGREFDARAIQDELRQEERNLGDRAAGIEEAFGIRPRISIAAGEPAATLLQAAENSAANKTLLAVGSRRLGAMQRIRLGSVSTTLLHAARGPILVCQQPPEKK